MSSEDRCKLLKWPTLSDHRIYLCLFECFKIAFGFYHLKFEDFFDFATIRSTRANHQYKLYVKPARIVINILFSLELSKYGKNYRVI